METSCGSNLCSFEDMLGDGSLMQVPVSPLPKWVPHPSVRTADKVHWRDMEDGGRKPSLASLSPDVVRAGLFTGTVSGVYQHSHHSTSKAWIHLDKRALPGQLRADAVLLPRKAASHSKTPSEHVHGIMCSSSVSSLAQSSTSACYMLIHALARIA
jgi:hypothetical protein